MKPAAFDYERPSELAAAVELLAGAGDGGRALAGGQSLAPMMNLRLARPSLLVDLGAIAALRSCERRDGGVVIGAMTTHAMVEDGAAPDPTGGMLRRVAAGIAYRAIRNRGTVGGSLAHVDPGGDWPTAMFALGAEVEVRGASGERRIPIDDLFAGAFTTTLEPAEILTGVMAPELSPAARWGYYKVVGKAGDLADSIGAAVFDPGRGIRRVALGGGDRPPLLLAGLSARLDEFADGGPDLAEALAAVGEARPDLDSIDRRIHATAVRRAVAQAFARR